MKKTLLTASVLLLTFPAVSAAQEACSIDALEAAEPCIEAAIEVCLQGTPCTAANYNALQFTDTIQDRLEGTCCVKKNKGQKNACLKRARSEVKTAKTILTPEQRKDLMDDIKEAMQNVKKSGQCVLDD